MHDKITELSRTDPIVHNALSIHFRGDLSYQQALELAVIALSEQHSILQRKVIECRERSTQQGPVDRRQIWKK